MPFAQFTTNVNRQITRTNARNHRLLATAIEEIRRRAQAGDPSLTPEELLSLTERLDVQNLMKLRSSISLDSDGGSQIANGSFSSHDPGGLQSNPMMTIAIQEPPGWAQRAARIALERDLAQPGPIANPAITALLHVHKQAYLASEPEDT